MYKKGHNIIELCYSKTHDNRKIGKIGALD